MHACRGCTQGPPQLAGLLNSSRDRSRCGSQTGSRRAETLRRATSTQSAPAVSARCAVNSSQGMPLPWSTLPETSPESAPVTTPQSSGRSLFQCPRQQLPAVHDSPLQYAGPFRPSLLEASEAPGRHAPAGQQAGAWDGRGSSRRAFLLSTFLSVLGSVELLSPGPRSRLTAEAVTVLPARIDPSTEPKEAFDHSDERLQNAASLFQQALNAESVQLEEFLWTEVIQVAEDGPNAPWVNDILSRAYGNRGNARSRQGKLADAVEDYNKAIAFAPYAADPVLNRGVVLETLRQFEDAAADYKAVLEYNPFDPSAWNNLGNVMAATGRWDEAAQDYKRAADLAPEFSFAAANYALALYQIGKDNAALKQMRSLLRRYPEFPDMRAALAVSLYSAGLFPEAETNWSRLEDLRYKDRKWVQDVRRWPPRLVAELESFLDVKPV